MAAPPRLKIVIFGQMQQVQDWSTSITANWTGNSPLITAGDVQGLVLDIEAMTRTWWMTINNLEGGQTSYQGCRLYYYQAAGDRATFSGEALTTAGPLFGGGTDNLPMFTSLVASFRTQRVGSSFRGRSYMPLTSCALDNTGQVSQANCGVVAGAYKALLNSIDAYTSTPNNVAALEAVVASATQSELTRITQVEVNSQPDTQHRRTDKLPAARVATQVIG